MHLAFEGWSDWRLRPDACAEDPPAISFIFITLFLDILEIGLVIPVLPKLVEQCRGGNVPEASTLVCQLSAVYALMQFVFSDGPGSAGRTELRGGLRRAAGDGRIDRRGGHAQTASGDGGVMEDRVGDEVTRLILGQAGTLVGRGAFEWKSESPDVVSYGLPMEAGASREWPGTWVGRGTFPWSEGFPQAVGDEVTRLTSIGWGTCEGRGACEWKSESSDVVPASRRYPRLKGFQTKRGG